MILGQMILRKLVGIACPKFHNTNWCVVVLGAKNTGRM
jgi:hypothetical protein